MPQWIFIFLLALYLFYILKKIFTLIFENGDPAKTVAWVLVILMVPILGIFLFLLIGKNQRKEKTFRKKYLADQDALRKVRNWKTLQLINDSDHVGVQKNIRLINLLQKNAKAPLSYGNKVKALQNGGPTFDAIYAAIQQAKQFVHLEYYIFLEGKVADQLLDLLTAKVKEGVAVRIIFDGVGSWPLKDTFLQKIKSAGIEIYPFMPVSFGPLANHINYRNHRKIVVIDGQIGFTGGINVADKYVLGDDELGLWRDTHLQINGPAVQQLNNIFNQDWFFVSNKSIGKETAVIPQAYPDGSPVQIVASGPDSDYANIRQEYFTLINEAEEYIYIATPYFIPGAAIIEALKVAALSGVEVILLLPRNSDSKVLKWCIRSYLEDLLKTGVRIFLYQNGFLHSKTIIADDDVASIGTANVDQRSFDQNFEVNALIYGPQICQELKTTFFQDLTESKELFIDQFIKRPFSEKMLESTARLLSPLL